MITESRNRLRAQVVEASECFNSWSRAGLVEGGESADDEVDSDKDDELDSLE